jgi:hypothetical protein
MSFPCFSCELSGSSPCFFQLHYCVHILCLGCFYEKALGKATMVCPSKSCGQEVSLSTAFHVEYNNDEGLVTYQGNPVSHWKPNPKLDALLIVSCIVVSFYHCIIVMWSVSYLTIVISYYYLQLCATIYK